MMRFAPFLFFVAGAIWLSAAVMYEADPEWSLAVAGLSFLAGCVQLVRQRQQT